MAIVALLALSGTLIAHELGYALVGARGSALHAYLGPLAGVLVPVGAVGLAVLGLNAAREQLAERSSGPTSLGGLRIARLAPLMIGLYAFQEVMERLAFGEALTTDQLPAIAAGLAAQPLVAGLLLLAVRWLGAGLSRLLDLSTVVPLPRAEAALIPVRVAPRQPSHLLRPVTRGPPRR